MIVPVTCNAHLCRARADCRSDGNARADTSRIRRVECGEARSLLTTDDRRLPSSTNWPHGKLCRLRPVSAALARLSTRCLPRKRRRSS